MKIQLTHEQRNTCDTAINFIRQKEQDYSTKLYEQNQMFEYLKGKKPIVAEKIFWSSAEDETGLTLKPYLYVTFRFGDYGRSHGAYFAIDNLEQAWRDILRTWEQNAIMWGIIDEKTKWEG